MRILIEPGDRDTGKTRSDGELVMAAKSGDMVAFVELYQRHYTKVLYTVYRITRNWEDAEDAVQDSFLKAFTHLNSFEGRSKFSTWFTRISINSSLMILRKRKIRQEVSLDDNGDDEMEPWQISDLRSVNPEALCIHKQHKNRIRHAALRMPPSLRPVVELRFLQCRSAQDISRELGISLIATKSRLIRAKRLLRTFIR